MPVHKLLLEGPIESFQMAIGLWMFGIIEEVHQTSFQTGCIEVLSELTTVVRLDSGSAKRSNLEELRQKVTAISR